MITDLFRPIMATDLRRATAFVWDAVSHIIRSARVELDGSLLSLAELSLSNLPIALPVFWQSLGDGIAAKSLALESNVIDDGSRDSTSTLLHRNVARAVLHLSGAVAKIASRGDIDQAMSPLLDSLRFAISSGGYIFHLDEEARGDSVRLAIRDQSRLAAIEYIATASQHYFFDYFTGVKHAIVTPDLLDAALEYQAVPSTELLTVLLGKLALSGHVSNRLIAGHLAQHSNHPTDCYALQLITHMQHPPESA